MVDSLGDEPLAYEKFGEIKWPISLFPTADVSLLILKEVFPLQTSVRETCP